MKPSRNVSPASAKEKAWLFLGLGLLVTVPYFWLQQHVLFPVTWIPLTALDRLVPFSPPAIWLYLSLYAQLTVPLFAANDSRELRRMSFGFAWITVVSHTLFFFWPTSIPSLIPQTSAPDPVLRLVLAADTNLNACPSLHASLAVYVALCSARLISKPKQILLWTWTFLILLATLLSKRHVILDLAAGGALGCFAYVAIFGTRPSETPGSEAWQATLRARAGLTQGMQPAVEKLTLHDWRKRLGEFFCFGTLGVCGASFTIMGMTASMLVSSRAIHWMFLLLGITITALALNAFVLLMHEGMHATLFPSRHWNRIGAVMLGSTFLMSFSAYRVLHIRHHNFLGDPRDPDDYHNYIRHPAIVWCLHFVRLACGSLLYLLLIPALALKYGTDQERRNILTEYAILLAAYSLLLRFVPISRLLMAWFIPLLIVGTLTAIRGFTQHGITDASDPYIASRTILPNPLVGFFLLHENFHLEHHLFPEVPSYHLPKLHQLVWPKLPRAVSGHSYLGFLAKFFQATSRLDETPIGLERPSAKST